jgi:hypothetical protein
VLVLWHLLRIGIGYIAATMVAGTVFAASAGPWKTVGGSPAMEPLVRVGGHAQVWLGETGGRLAIGLLHLLLTGFPTVGFVVVWVVGVAAAETWSLRPLTLWLAVGGLAGMALMVPRPLAVVASAGSTTLGDETWLAALAAGFVAGFFYWLVAGRKSGGWRRALPPSA